MYEIHYTNDDDIRSVMGPMSWPDLSLGLEVIAPIAREVEVVNVHTRNSEIIRVGRRGPITLPEHPI